MLDSPHCQERQTEYAACCGQWQNDRPLNMEINGRPVVDAFAQGENLFFRLHPTNYLLGKVHTGGYPLPDQSVCRSGLQGETWYVLIPDRLTSEQQADTARVQRNSDRLCNGIAALVCGSLPETLEGRFDDLIFSVQLRPAHDPLEAEANYYHCELRLFQEGNHLDRKNFEALPSRVQKAIKRVYRERLADLTTILLEPAG